MTNEELALRIVAGESDLSLDLWNQVEKFVHWQANRFYFGYQDRCKQLSIELDDLRQEGYLAMLTAVEKFDPARRTKFLTVFGYYLKKRFFTMAKMHYTGWQRNKVHRSASLDAMISENDKENLLDTIADERNELEEVDEAIYWATVLPSLTQAFATLTKRQQEILVSIYYEGNTHEATAKKFGISKGGVSTIARGGMNKLRNNAALLAACAY